MELRRSNPSQPARWGLWWRGGAAVAAVALGTTATIVISEWSSAANGRASGSLAGSDQRVGAEAVEPSARDLVEGAERPKLTPRWPGIISAGSAEEARRRTEASNPAREPAGLSLLASDEQAKPTDDELRGHAFVDEILAYNAARTAGTLRVAQPLVINPVRAQTGAGADQRKVSAEAYDFSALVDTLSEVTVFSPLNLGMIAGLQAQGIWDRAVGTFRPAAAAPTAEGGGDARWNWTDSGRSMLRASALSDAPGTDHDYLDVRLEQVWKVGADTSFSLGWRHQRGVLSNEQPESALRDDAILLEFRIGF